MNLPLAVLQMATKVATPTKKPTTAINKNIYGQLTIAVSHIKQGRMLSKRDDE